MQKEVNAKPLEYVRGFTEFLECKIDLSKKPLIPRVETEFWVNEALKNIKRGRALDIFAGSGCIGVAILKHNKNVLCDFSDSEKNCIEQIKINCELNDIDKKRYKVIKSDVFSNIKGKYDYIFANPPYVAVKNKNLVQKSVLNYEPHKALFGGENGLFYIKKFLGQAVGHLNPSGRIFMEFSPEQKNAIEKLIKKYKYSKHKFKKDQYGKWRWVVIG